jgi:spore maturation protein CgeB
VRILVIGDWYSALHEELVSQAFKTLGHEVFPFGWHTYFKPRRAVTGPTGKLEHFVLKVQNHFIIGPKVASINCDALRAVDQFSPDMVFVYRGTHLFPSTLRRIKERNPATVLVGYNTDNAFVSGHLYGLWRHFLRGLPFYDLMLAFRAQNVEDFKRAGAKRAELLRFWFTPELNRRVELSPEEQEQYGSDVVFVGNYEPHGRLEWLEEIAKAGFNLRLFGPGKYWNGKLRQSPWLRHLAPVSEAWGENYNKALCGAKVALCLLSKLNRDTYTCRCFEIPATKTMLLSEYTEDLATLYTEGVEAEFFRSNDELIVKLQRYVSDEALRLRVAEAGYQRVVADKHDVISRMRQVLAWVNEIR